MNTSLPAQIQTPNLAETLMRGREMQMYAQEMQNRNALSGFLKENGAAVMAGDPNKLSQLFSINPEMGMNILGQQRQDARAERADARSERAYDLDVRRTDASIADSDARLGIARQQAAQSAAEHGARMSAFEREAEAVAIKRSGDMAAAAYALGPEEWAGFQETDEGAVYAQFGYDTAPIAIAGARGTLEGLGLGDGEQFTLGNNQARYDAQGNLIARGPEKPAEPMSPEGKLAADVRNGLVDPNATPAPTAAFQALHERAIAADLLPGTPEYGDFMINGGVQRTQSVNPTFRPATPEEAQRYGASAGQIDDATGRFYPAESKDTTTEGERKAAGYLGRMVAAGQVIDQTPEAGQRINRAQDWLSWVGVPDSWIFSGDEATVIQKQMDWVRAKLRYESGAVIGDDEAREEAATYFPRPGDSDARVAAKKSSREQAIEQMRLAAGRAAPGSAGAAAVAPADATLAPPPEILDQLQGQPAGTRVQGPDGRTYVWDGQGLSAE